MKLIKILMATALMLISSASLAVPITFMSGNDDGCKSCSLENQTGKRYLDPVGTDLDGASWIQTDDAWRVVGDYRVWEFDLSKTGIVNTITSLFVAFDDKLVIKSNKEVLFNSDDYNISRPWTSITNIIDLTGDLVIADDARLNFYVENTGGPTGVIWKGVAVPEPLSFAMLGLGLLGFAFTRKGKLAAKIQ